MSEENQHLDLSQQQQQAAPPEPQEQQQPQQQPQIEQQETTLSEKFNFSCSESDLINQSGHQMDLSESSEVNKSTIAENFIVETAIIEKKVDEDHHVVIEESMSELEAASREAVDAAIGQIARLEEQQEEEKRAAFVDNQHTDTQVVETTNSAVVEPINEQITAEEPTTVAVAVNLEPTESQSQNEEKLKVIKN